MNNVKKGLQKRVFKNWKTSLLGVVLLTVALFALLTGKATLTEVAVFLPTCLFLIYARDTFFKINPKE